MKRILFLGLGDGDYQALLKPFMGGGLIPVRPAPNEELYEAIRFHSHDVAVIDIDAAPEHTVRDIVGREADQGIPVILLGGYECACELSLGLGAERVRILDKPVQACALIPLIHEAGEAATEAEPDSSASRDDAPSSAGELPGETRLRETLAEHKRLAAEREAALQAALRDADEARGGFDEALQVRKALEVELAGARALADDMQQQRDETAHSLRQARQSAEASANKAQRLSASMERLRDEMNERVETLAARDRQLEEAHGEIERLRAQSAESDTQRQALNQRLDEAAHYAESLQQDRDALAAELAGLTDRYQALRDESETLRDQLDTLYAEVEQSNRQHQRAMSERAEALRQSNEALEAARQKAADLAERLGEAEGRRRQAECERDDAAERLTSQQRKAIGLEDELMRVRSSLESQIAEARVELDRRATLFDETQQELDAEHQAAAALQEKNEQARARLDDMSAYAERAQQRIAELEIVLEQREASLLQAGERLDAMTQSRDAGRRLASKLGVKLSEANGQIAQLRESVAVMDALAAERDRLQTQVDELTGQYGADMRLLEEAIDDARRQKDETAQALEAVRAELAQRGEQTSAEKQQLEDTLSQERQRYESELNAARSLQESIRTDYQMRLNQSAEALRQREEALAADIQNRQDEYASALKRQRTEFDAAIAAQKDETAQALQAREAELTHAAEAAQAREAELNAAIDALKRQHESVERDLNERIAERDEMTAALRDEIETLSQQAAERDEAIAALRDQNGRQISELSAQADAARAESQRQLIEIGRLNKLLGEARALHESARNEMDRLAREHRKGATAMQRHIDELEGARNTLAHRAETAEADLAEARRRLRQNDEVIASLKDRLRQAGEKIEHLNETLASVREASARRKEEYVAQREQLRHRLQEAGKAEKALGAERDTARTDAAEARHAIESLNAEIERLNAQRAEAEREAAQSAGALKAALEKETARARELANRLLMTSASEEERDRYTGFLRAEIEQLKQKMDAQRSGLLERIAGEEALRRDVEEQLAAETGRADKAAAEAVDMAAQRQALDAGIKKLQDTLSETRQMHERAEAGLRSRIEALRAERDAVACERDRLVGELDIVRTEAQHNTENYAQNHARIEKELHEAQRRGESLARQIGDLKLKLQAKDEEAAATYERLAAELRTKAAGLENLQEAYNRSRAEVRKLSDLCARLDPHSAAGELVARSEVAQKMDDMQRENDSLGNTVRVLRDELEGVRGELEQLQKSLALRDGQLDALSKRRDEDVARLRTQLDDANERRHLDIAELTQRVQEAVAQRDSTAADAKRLLNEQAKAHAAELTENLSAAAQEAESRLAEQAAAAQAQFDELARQKDEALSALREQADREREKNTVLAERLRQSKELNLKAAERIESLCAEKDGRIEELTRHAEGLQARVATSAEALQAARTRNAHDVARMAEQQQAMQEEMRKMKTASIQELRQRQDAAAPLCDPATGGAPDNGEPNTPPPPLRRGLRYSQITKKLASQG